MDAIQILTISTKADFQKLIQDGLRSSQKTHPFLPPVQVEQLPSLPEKDSLEFQDSSRIVVVDLDSMKVDLEGVLNQLKDSLLGRVLVLVSDQELSSMLSPDDFVTPFYALTKDQVTSSLFSTLMSSLVSQSHLTMEYHSTRMELNHRMNELMSLRKASLHLTMNLSLDSVLEAILDSAMELLDAHDTHIFLYEHGALSFGAALFNGHQQKKPFMNPRPHGLTYQVAREGTMKVINDVMTDPLFKDRRWNGSIISIPLKIGKKVLGVMNVALQHPHDFTENEIRAIEFLGDQASIAIQNANLYEQAQQEIADRIKAEEAIKHLANHDALTGLPNRRLFNERINLEISRAQRNNQKIGIMLFDLDHLKKVNDSFGHNVGDLLLQAVAQRLLGLLRKSDTVARMGGDEFLLILPEMNQPEDAFQTAERILETLSRPFHLEGYQVNITTSIGISFYPDDGDEVNTLIKKADIAMYKAKDKGGNIYHLFTS